MVVDIQGEQRIRVGKGVGIKAIGQGGGQDRQGDWEDDEEGKGGQTVCEVASRRFI